MRGREKVDKLRNYTRLPSKTKHSGLLSKKHNYEQPSPPLIPIPIEQTLGKCLNRTFFTQKNEFVLTGVGTHQKN